VRHFKRAKPQPAQSSSDSAKKIHAQSAARMRTRDGSNGSINGAVAGFERSEVLPCLFFFTSRCGLGRWVLRRVACRRAASASRNSGATDVGATGV